MIAKLVRKGPWKDGQFPSAKKGLAYRTRQLIFEIEDTDEYLRVNVHDHLDKSMKFNKLKVGDRIREFTLLVNKPIINPESSFVMHSDAALF